MLHNSYKLKKKMDEMVMPKSDKEKEYNKIKEVLTGWFKIVGPNSDLNFKSIWILCSKRICSKFT